MQVGSRDRLIAGRLGLANSCWFSSDELNILPIGFDNPLPQISIFRSFNKV